MNDKEYDMNNTNEQQNTNENSQPNTKENTQPNTGFQHNTNTQHQPYQAYGQQQPYYRNQPQQPQYQQNRAPYPPYSAPSSPQNPLNADVVITGDDGQPPKKKRGKWLLGIVALLLVVTLIITALLSLQRDKPRDVIDESETSSALQIDDDQNKNILSPEIIAEKVRPSVTAIIVYKNGKVAGEGSGVIMSESSDKKQTYIITCAHVVKANTSNIEVLTADSQTYAAKLIGMDERSDLAVLSIEASGLTPASFGDSDQLKVGESIYAIGNPGGSAFFGSFTSGVVSAIDRPITPSSIGYTMKTIQHDAAINPGNSGGALINNKGEVIGINSSKIANEEYEGMAFAIPISTAKPIIDNIIANGYVPNRPSIGIEYTAATSNQLYALIVRRNNLPTGAIVVENILEHSSLTNTDLKTQDVIYAVNGEDMTSTSVLLAAIEKSKVGDEITLDVARINSSDYSLTKFQVKAKLVESKTQDS